ncbi:MAG: DUF211 domain-containing protein, partial [Candidatus Micrarchaeota archaeon]|nr:DUF211 domain-containing protein [Candidatus Micrarchaeota archaeon]
ITLSEIDQETESVKITIVGTNMEYEEIRKVIEDLGGVVHSIDEVVAAGSIVSSVLLQDYGSVESCQTWVNSS